MTQGESSHAVVGAAHRRPALALAAPSGGVQSDGTASCDSNGFARALRALRPELEIVPVDSQLTASAVVPRLPIGAWLAQIEGLQSDQAVLRVTGNPTPLLRPLPGQDCLRVVQIMASIVDAGFSDQLPNPARDVGLR